jgi:DNA-directed RNA polymerase specialized sigma24 family protein
MRTVPPTALTRPNPPHLQAEDLEHLMRRAHVHLSRYFRSWLSGVPGGATLAEELALEALVRIARSPEMLGAPTDKETAPRILEIAHALAREVAGS